MRALWLTGLVSIACAGPAAVRRPDPVAPPGPPSPEAQASYREALATFTAIDAEGRWQGGDCQRALAGFEAANRAAGGTLAAAVFMSGRVAERCGNDAGARALYGRALELEPALCEAHTALGLLELERGEPAAARARFQEAVRRDARCAPAYVDLAILQGEREPDEALANLRRALAARADYLPALNQMALLYLAQAGAHRELLDLAEMVCRQAQLVDPDWAPLYNTWALIDLERAELTAAAAKLTRATVLDPSFFEAHMNLGQLLLSQRAYEDAAAAFERARGLRPSSYDAILGHGVAQRGLRRIADAEASYMAAIEADAARPEAYFDLGVLYMDHRDGTGEDLSRAAGFFRQFVERARARPALASTVADVERRCDAAPAGRGGGRARSACRPGRLQLIEIAAATMDTMRRQEERPGEPKSQSQ